MQLLGSTSLTEWALDEPMGDVKLFYRVTALLP